MCAGRLAYGPTNFAQGPRLPPMKMRQRCVDASRAKFFRGSSVLCCAHAASTLRSSAGGVIAETLAAVSARTMDASPALVSPLLAIEKHGTLPGVDSTTDPRSHQPPEQGRPRRPDSSNTRSTQSVTQPLEDVVPRNELHITPLDLRDATLDLDPPRQADIEVLRAVERFNEEQSELGAFPFRTAAPRSP